MPYVDSTGYPEGSLMFLLKNIFWLACITLLGAACKSQTSHQLLADADNAMVGIAALSSAQKVQLMASFSAAAYCENGNDSCGILQNLADNIGFLGLSPELAQWRPVFISAIDDSKSVKGYVFAKDGSNDVVVAIRGSATRLEDGAIQNWFATNANMGTKRYEGPKVRGGVHTGFLEAFYGILHPNETGLSKVSRDLDFAGKTIWVTGHSAGGAIGSLVAMRFAEENLNLAGVYAFGTPRFADYSFQASYNMLLAGRVFQYVNREDPIPHLPPHFVAVGDVFRMTGGFVERYGKDGADAWDIWGAMSYGNAAQHVLIERNGVSYIETIKVSQGL